MSASGSTENTASSHLEPLELDSHHSMTPIISNRLHGKQEIRDTLRPLVARGSDSRGDYMSAPADDYQPDELHVLAKETGIIIRKAEVMLPVSTLKWDWLSTTFRPMQHVQAFDSASRGIIGSLQLLPDIAYRQPLALGAIIISVLSLGIGSFTQQSIQTYQCLQPARSRDHSATINVANTADSEEFARLDGSKMRFALNMKMQFATKEAILSSPDVVSSLFSCPSGNCTFPTFSNGPKQTKSEQMSHASVGICSRCADIYELVQGPVRLNRKDDFNQGIFYFLPNDRTKHGSRIALAQDGVYQDDIYMSVRVTKDLNWTRQVVDTDFLRRARWSISNVTFLATSQDHCDRLPDGNITCPHSCDQKSVEDQTCVLDSRTRSGPTDYAAAACILYPCTKYYTATVNSSQLSEKTVWDIPLRIQSLEPIWSAKSRDPKLPTRWKGVAQPCIVNGSLYDLSKSPSAQKVQNPQLTQVYFHEGDWSRQSISKPSYPVNMAVPADCIVELPIGLDWAFANEFNSTMNTNCKVAQGVTTALQCGNIDAKKDDRGSCLSPLSLLFYNDSTSITNITRAIDSVATRITNEIRKVGTGPRVTGNTWESHVCVHIVWKWLFFPGALLASCAVLLFAVIVKEALSKNKNIWKSSVLPLLLKDYYGLERMGLKQVEEAAEQFEVKLQKKRDEV
ncbi:hypothetical protein F53441_7459 [Fusarium austroafricanum]|uniref:Uncharacterized protein n=1 Tax=Fusarium austroafricanum TaxID=2364996 RepID=A0A8H4KFK1_9HYPO|nr:hypothetical protein F53441_7459 [Fusarium austroafricanum]